MTSFYQSLTENVKSKILFIMHMPLPVYGTAIGLFLILIIKKLL